MLCMFWIRSIWCYIINKDVILLHMIIKLNFLYLYICCITNLENKTVCLSIFDKNLHEMTTVLGANLLLQMCKYVQSHWVTSVFVRTSVCSCICVWRMYVGVYLQTSVSVSLICESMHICTIVGAFAWLHRCIFFFPFCSLLSVR